MGGPSLLDQAAELLRLAEVEPGQAASAAADLGRSARAARDPAAEAIAERAWGLALRHRGDLDSAIAHLRRAVRTATRAGSPQVAGEARMTLAFALVERGRPRQALGEIGRALASLDGVAQARALTQRGTILLELGYHGEAEASYGRALPALQAAGDVIWTRRAVENRGLARAYRHRFREAEEDLLEAVRLGDELDLPLMVGFTQANLAFVHGLRGDVAAALDCFGRAERRIRQHRAQLGTLLQDRAELLLSVRLVAEARETAQLAVEAYEQERRGIRLPEVRLVLAQAALLDGDGGQAATQARQAAREFVRQGRPDWGALARLAAVRAEYAAFGRPRTPTGAIEEDVRKVAATGWPTATMEGRLLAAQVLLDRGQPARAEAYLHAASAGRRRGPATLRARGWYAEATLHAAHGRRRRAVSALAAGLRILDEHRAALAATDLRARAAAHRVELVELGLRLAVEDGDARRVLEWAERGRTGELRQRPVVPPEDPVLARWLAELRSTVRLLTELRGAGRGGAAVARLAGQQLTLERQIRDWSRRKPGSVAGPALAPVRAGQLAAALADRALLELVVLDGALHAVTVVDGRRRLRRLVPIETVDRLLDRIGFAMHRLIRRGAGGANVPAALKLLGAAAATVDGLLFGPLPEIGDRPLVVVPTGPLQCLPWAVLPSCAGRPITVAPSATLWHRASTSTDSGAGAVACAAGPMLRGADEEARAVAAVHGVPAMLPPGGTVEEVIKAADGAALLHLAAHGRLAAHNPLFSDLLLADGPLFAYDLERLDRAPHTVVLAACDSARSVVCAGDELLGLSAAFLAHGTRQLVASMLPVLDAETAPVMVAFHRLLASGRTPAEALATAQQQLGSDPAAMAAAGFVCLGAGFSAPPLAPGVSAGAR